MRDAYLELLARQGQTADKTRSDMEREEAIINGTCLHLVDQEALETLIPELKESCNERIKEDIVALIKFALEDGSAVSPGSHTTKEEALDWLERQGNLMKALQTSNAQMGELVEENYKLKEQKPADGTALQKAFISSKIDYTLEEKCDASDYAESILPTNVAYGENEEEYKLHKIIEAAFIAGQKKELKPAEWSELQSEFKNINEAFEDGKKEVVAHPEKYGLCECVPAEWSEEDKRAIDRACVALRAYSNGDLPEYLPSELLDYADRLQSLRPRPHWKPSEEQPSLPDNLDEAAREIVIKMHPCLKDCTILGDRLTRGQLMALVKAGAEWLAKQGHSQEEIVEDKTLEPCYGTLSGIDPIINLSDSFKPGDKVIVQVRKK